MPTTTTTHLNFDGQAADALAFYASATGGEVASFSYRQAGFPLQDDADLDKLAWGEVRAPGGFHVMAYDVRAEQTYDPGDRPFYVSLRSDTEDEVRALWEGLSDGATVEQDLAPASWSPLYGMLTDRFGVTWVLDVVVAWG